MWVTNNLGYDITFDGVTIYKNSQQEVTDAQKTILNKNDMFIAITTEGEGLVKSDSQPDVNPQYYVRPLSAVPTLDGMPTNPKGYPAVSPAEAFDLGKESGGSADLDKNKEVTINVSTYTDPVEIEPTEGKDGMEKATVTLSNIPQLEENKASTIDVSTYTEPVEVTPTEGKDGMEKATVTLSNIPNKLHCWTATAEGKQTQKVYFNFSASPANSEEFSQGIALGISNTTTKTLGLSPSQYILDTQVGEYEKTSDSQFRVVDQIDSTVWTLNRASNNDITLWSM